MHHCLLIPELALYIIRFLADDRPGCHGSRYLTNPNDVAKLARTCRALAEPALDVLWATQHSLAPLIMCLPPDIWELTGTRRGKTIFFKRRPAPQDWLSVQKYAHRIQSISQPVLLSVPRLDDAVLAALVAPSNFGGLFPSLRSLDYSVISVAAPLVHLLTDVLSTARYLESVSSLRVTCPRTSQREEVYDLFEAIRTKATRLESLRIESFASMASDSSLAVRLREGEFKFLLKLDLSWSIHVSRECLACVVRMAYLQDMNLCVRCDIDLDFLINGCSFPDTSRHGRMTNKRTFPVLKSLRVMAHSLDQCTALLALVTSPFLDSIAFYYDVQAPSRLIEAFFGQVQRTCRDAITTSTCPPTAPVAPPRAVSLTLKHNRGPLSSPSTPYLIHPPQTLSPLLALRHLRTLRLIHLGTIAVDDGFLREAASAWGAHLQELEECGTPSVGVEESNDLPRFVAATLDGIGTFVTGCSRLKRLRMAFDGRDVPLHEVCSDERANNTSTLGEEDIYDGDQVTAEDGQQQSGTPSLSSSSSSPLQVLNVRDSPIDNPEDVAKFLKRVAPALRVICVEGSLEMWKKWREVEDRMKLSGTC